MPIHFSKSKNSNVSTALSPDALDAATHKLTNNANALGFFQKRDLKRHQNEALVDFEKQKTSVLHAEAVATLGFAVALQGTLARTALARVNGELLAAQMTAMSESHRAVVLEQSDGRYTGAVMNQQVCNEHVADLQARFTRGEISAEDAQALAHTATDLRADVEARLDGMYQETAQTTDRVFKGGFVQVNNKMLGH
jgi:hypothetical protein